MESLVMPTTPASPRIKRYLKFIVSYLITAIFIFALFHGINWQQVKTLLLNANLIYVVLGLCSLTLGLGCRSLRWSLMLRRIDNSVTYSESIPRFLYSFAMNNVLPLRAGDVYRMFAFKHKPNLSITKIFSTLVLERLLDLVVLLALFFITLHWVKISLVPHYFISTLQGMIVIVCILLLTLVMFPLRTKLLLNYVNQRYLLNRHALLVKITEKIAQFCDAIIIMRSPAYLSCLVLLSILAWGLEGGLFLFSAYAMQYHGNVIGPYFAATLGTLSTLLPSAPGYVGTFDYFTMLGFKAYGVNADIATASALLIHLLLWLPITVFGLVYHFKLTLSNNKGTNQ